MRGDYSADGGVWQAKKSGFLQENAIFLRFRVLFGRRQGKKSPAGVVAGLEKQRRGSVVVGLVFVDHVAFAVLFIAPIIVLFIVLFIILFIVHVGAELLCLLIGAQGNIHMEAHELL